ncbi:HlyD family efflux transporter periplasmic adaptor subunit [Alteromonas sp. 345S023]|uniref:HlyD family efflux transporter periplasmic adaptor subunit n=1 Tax=Alteromonas profundi TaxID=2696062 RepID=A0A7X5RMK1_9ALTE|nr:HlyD family secretion protein [Alteromonas profundi]NDV92610.1 HlyD family efflux transporter periplasmic adaptor subunit [Alteromonas profundi]
MALSRSLKLSSAVVCLALVIGSVFYFNRPASSDRVQTTNDAYFDADLSYLGARVAGTVSRVLIKENQIVKKGDLLFEIDDNDFRLAVTQREANVHQAQANLLRAQAALAQHATTIAQSKADVEANQASLSLAELDKIRFSNLAKDGSGSVQAQQKADANVRISQAALSKSQALLAFNQAQKQVLEADLARAQAALEVAKANLESAQLNLSYTRIYAPNDGVVGQKKVEVGEVVNKGTVLAALVPTNALYITANFRETQLANIRKGQKVDIDVDALPGVSLQGTVESIGPASQVSYLAIAPVNATGNFTKIVQRLPVRISIAAQDGFDSQLRVGMSVIPHIQTQSADVVSHTK